MAIRLESQSKQHCYSSALDAAGASRLIALSRSRCRGSDRQNTSKILYYETFFSVTRTAPAVRQHLSSKRLPPLERKPLQQKGANARAIVQDTRVTRHHRTPSAGNSERLKNTGGREPLKQSPSQCSHPIIPIHENCD